MKEALKRVPAHKLDERSFRIIRAMQLSIQKIELPKEQWTKFEEVNLKFIDYHYCCIIIFILNRMTVIYHLYLKRSLKKEKRKNIGKKIIIKLFKTLNKMHSQ